MKAIGPQVPVRALRHAYGLTLKDLSERIEAFGVTVDEDHLSNCELGRRCPSRPLVKAWADALKINPLDLTVHPSPKRDVA